MATTIETSDGHVFNCAAQLGNHDLYWKSIDPSGNSRPSNELQASIELSFGNVGQLYSALKEAGAGEFGSNWVWLIYNPSTAQPCVTSTTNTQNSIPKEVPPLLTIDV